MLNILTAGELHYWNVLRQHIQDNDRGDRVSHTVLTVQLPWLIENTLRQHWLGSVRQLMSSFSDQPPRSPSAVIH